MLQTASVILSALLYIGAFMYPKQCHWLVFFFLMPLYGAGATDKKHALGKSFLHGLLWGALVFAAHLYAVLCMFLQQTTFSAAVLVWMMLVVYCALFAGLWFMTASFFSPRQGALGAILAVWVVTTSCFFEVVRHLIFIIFLLPCGYRVAYPLVPLAQWPEWLFCLQYIPPWMLLVCIAISSAACVISILTGDYRFLLLCSISLSPCLVGWWCGVPQASFGHHASCVHIQAPSYAELHSGDSLTVAQSLHHGMSAALQQFPQARCLLFAESVYPFSLENDHEVQQIWQQNALSLSDEVRVILGAYRSVSHNKMLLSMNSVFVCDARRIIHIYDKQTYVPFLEVIPWPWNRSRFCRNFLLKNKPECYVSSASAEPFQLLSGLRVEVYVCSDLFCNEPRMQEEKLPILWLVHDAWSPAAYYKRLMLLYAQFFSMTHKRSILYSSHYYGIWIEPFTHYCSLSSVSCCIKSD